MTEPTQAQIEAARKMLQLSTCFGRDVCTLMPCACAKTIAALTAAAQAEDDKDWAHAAAMAANRTPDAFVDAVRAAQVGDDGMDELKITVATYKNGFNDALERCAQVAETAEVRRPGFAIRPATPQEIAAAIRALKDKT
jgi:hypothetical protein